MLKMFKSIFDFINYWYFRYLLVTELYMVEKWERVVMHVVFVIFFSLLYLFNSTVVVSSVKYLTKNWFDSHNTEHFGHTFLDGSHNMLG